MKGPNIASVDAAPVGPVELEPSKGVAGGARAESLVSLEGLARQQLFALEAMRAEMARWHEELRLVRQEAESRAQVIEELQRQLSTEQALARAFVDEAQAGAQAVARLERQLGIEQGRADASAEEAQARARVIEQLQQELREWQERAHTGGEEAQVRSRSIKQLEAELRQEQGRTQELAGDIENLRRQLVAEQARTQALTGTSLRLERTTEALRLRAEAAERSRRESVDRLDRLKAGVTFRTGEALIKAVKSPSALLKLPATLLRIARDRKVPRQAGARVAGLANAPHGSLPFSASREARKAIAERKVPKLSVALLPRLQQLQIAVVGSAQTVAAFSAESEVVDPTAAGDRAHFVLIDASAMRSQRWSTQQGHPSQELAALVQRSRSQGVPTVLWAFALTLDEQHFAWAALVDHLFLADMDRIAEWRGALGHNRVHVLPCAVAGGEHNPLRREVGEDAFRELAAGAHNPQSPSDLPQEALVMLARHGVAACSYSYALRLLFGRLVISSNAAGERQRQLDLRRSDPEHDRKLRAAALRKVHAEHGYGQRLASIAHSLADTAPPAATTATVRVCAVATPGDQAELEHVIASHRRQATPADLLVIVAGPNLSVPEAADLRRADSLADVAQYLAGMEAVLPISGKDYYGRHYLDTLLMASRWAPDAVITRGPIFRAAAGDIVALEEEAPAYSRVSRAWWRRSLMPARMWAEVSRAAAKIDDALLEVLEAVTVDAFDYCQDAHVHGADLYALQTRVDSVPGASSGGVPLTHLNALAEVYERSEDDAIEPPLALAACEWLSRLSGTAEGVKLTLEGDKVHVDARLKPGEYRYLYLANSFPAERFGSGDRICGLEGEATGSLLLVLVFQDVLGRKISHEMHAPGKQMALVLPNGTASVRLAVRIEGTVRGVLGTMTASAARQTARPMLGGAQHLLVAKQYPGYEDLYRFAFVHSRVRGYLQGGGAVDVLRIRPEPGCIHREFENVDITEADLRYLDASLSKEMYSSILVHFMDPATWAVLRRHLDKVQVTVWVHGADVQPWWRRSTIYEHPARKQRAREVTDERLSTWRELFAMEHPNLRVVFVSRKQADETLCDLGLNPDRAGVEVIHNFIDGDLFAYREKPVEQRLRILSIRPYASAVYANDLTAQAILHLSKRPIFDRMHFKLVGDGVLWEQIVEPLRELPNVELVRGFVTQREIAAMHRDYGIFLVPSRMDSQGVSRDEAMASGLVPVTTRVAAIPEFVDDACGVLCPPEDPLALADAIEALAADPDRFAALSRAAAERVRQQSGRAQTIARELALIERKLPPAAALNRFDRRIAVYGDLNLNILDGSAIWAASLTETLAGLPRTQVCLLLKARIQRVTVISRLLGLAPAVQIVEPSLPPARAMEPSEAVQRLVELDAERPFRAFVLRGLDLCTAAVAVPQLYGRIWAYLTDVPQAREAMDGRTRESIEAIASACEFLLCQTPEMEAYLCQLFPSVRGRTRLLPPMVPAAPEPPPKPRSARSLRLCYAGKFAPNWGINELAEAFMALRRTAPKAELHVYGDKIHQVPSDPDFHRRTSEWLAETPGLVWHGAVDRDMLMRALPGMDVCWAYRDPRFEHGTLELSTKLLEYASLGVPMILTRSPVNESVLGRQYPLFVNSAKEAEALLQRIADDRSLLAQAAAELRSGVSGYTFEAVRKRLLAQGLG